MTMTPEGVPAFSLTAHIEERILAPLRRSMRATRWFTVTLALMLGLHGAILAGLLYRDSTTKVASRQETPVEVIVEPPKPPEPPKPKEAEKKPEPPQPPQQAIEKPATSAPREANDTKVDTAQLQKETHAPKAPVPPTDGQKAPETDASSPSEEPTPQPEKAEEPDAKPDVLQKDAEVLTRAAEQPKPKPKKVAKAAPKAKTKRARTARQQLAGASELPDYSFARPTKKSKVTGGTEDSRYLAIVYGMIMQNQNRVSIPGDQPSNVTIAFEVDDDGNIIDMGVQNTSGSPEVDAAAADAIRRAAPFPPPPAGAPHGLVATIVYGDS